MESASQAQSLIDASASCDTDPPRCNRDTGHRASALLRGVLIRPGTISDYHALARFHYIPGTPAAFVRVLCAELMCEVPACWGMGTSPGRVPANRLLLGVLGISMPVLNSRLRPLAWPGRYRTGDRRADALRINRELRTISRVIIDPRVRGIGLAARLVREYLADPQTPATEGIAAMGQFCPFMLAGGMRQYQLAPLAHESRFADALAAMGVGPVDVLADAGCRRFVLGSDFLQRELSRFMQGSPKRRQSRLAHEDALVWACAALCSPRVAYAHSKEIKQ